MKMQSLMTLGVAILCLFAGKRASADQHVLVAGDTIQIAVFDEPELDKTATLSKDGKVALALVGEIGLAGLTAEQAGSAIVARYKQGYLAKPQVTVSVTDYAKRRFTILGEVNKPGAFYFPEGETLTLLQAIGLAGGYSKIANPSKIMIKREGSSEPIRVDAKKLASEPSAKPFEIRPGDVIEVKESIF